MSALLDRAVPTATGQRAGSRRSASGGAGDGLLATRPLPAWGTAAYAVTAAVASGAVAVSFGLPHGALTAAVLAAGHALVVRPTLLCVLAVALVPVTAGLARGVPVPGLRVSEVVVALTAVVVLGLRGLRRGPQWTPVDWLALLYVALHAGLGLVSVVVVRQEALTTGQLQTLAGPAQFFLLYRCVVTQLRGERARRVAVGAVMAASVPVSLLAVGQMLGPRAFHELSVALTATTVFDRVGFVPMLRATSVFPHWHSLAAYSLVVALLGTALLIDRRRSTAATVGLCLATALAATAMLLTLTATTLGLLLVGVLALGWWYHKPGRVLAVLAAGGAGSVLAFGPLILARVRAQADPGSGGGLLPETVAYRLEVWSTQYVPILYRHLALGYGPDLPDGPQWLHTESGYLTFLLRGGLPLLAAVVALVVAVFATARRSARTSVGSQRSVARTTAVICLLLPVGSLVFPYLTSSGMPQLLFPLWGLVVAGATAGDRARRVHASTALVPRPRV